MTNQTKQLQALFPDMPRNLTVTDDNGMLTQEWFLGLSSLFQALQKNYKNEGLMFPPLTQSELNTIQSMYAPYIGSPLPQDDPTVSGQLNIPDISGQTVFDSTNRIPKQFIITYDTSSPPNVLSAQWLILNVMTTYAGNPNGHIAGVLNWLCYDTTDKALYICTTSGSTSSAVWTLI